MHTIYLGRVTRSALYKILPKVLRVALHEQPKTGRRLRVKEVLDNVRMGRKVLQIDDFLGPLQSTIPGWYLLDVSTGWVCRIARNLLHSARKTIHCGRVVLLDAIGNINALANLDPVEMDHLLRVLIIVDRILHGGALLKRLA